MNKSLIKKYLNSTFLMEADKPKGLSSTLATGKESAKINKAAMKDLEKKMKDYTKMDGEEENDEATKKYENNKEEQEYVDLVNYNQGSIINLDSDNPPGDAWEEKQRQAITGKDSVQGNAVYDEDGNPLGNVVTDDQAGFTGPEANQKIYDNNKKFKKKAGEASKGMEARLGTSTTSDTNDKYLKENKMKRLVFKKEFNGVENALKMIPESYKVDNKEFHMTDGNENYEMRWEGSLTEGKAIILKASDKGLMNEDMTHMKHLMGYKSENTLGTLKGEARLNENKSFNDVWGKTKTLLSEGDTDKTKD